jgi:nucleoside-diphosphate-sugar epimerase
MNRTALIIGATGGIGSETTRALVASGWAVRALHRNPEEAARKYSFGPVEWVKGDAMNPADAVAASAGASVVVHAVNPPKYRNWKGLALPMLESSIAAAKASGARIAFPGTVYNFGPDAFGLVDESAPQHPKTRKGAIRVAMEERLREASRDGVPVLVVRAGDFFGVPGGNSWFTQGLVKPGQPLRSVTYPGQREVGHAWAYLPDLATTFARLLDRQSDLGAFEVFHFGGHWFERGVDFADSIRRAAGIPSAPIRRFPWFAIYALAPFNETFREMLEMRYLWAEPLRLDNRKLVAFLGYEPHTPIDDALRHSLGELGCLGTSMVPLRKASPTVA